MCVCTTSERVAAALRSRLRGSTSPPIDIVSGVHSLHCRENSQSRILRPATSSSKPNSFNLPDQTLVLESETCCQRKQHVRDCLVASCQRFVHLLEHVAVTWANIQFQGYSKMTCGPQNSSMANLSAFSASCRPAMRGFVEPQNSYQGPQSLSGHTHAAAAHHQLAGFLS